MEALLKSYVQKGGNMAAPQFSTSKPQQLPKSRRRFTLAEANRSLPLVSRIVRDIVEAHDKATQLQRKLENCTAKEATALQDRLDLALEHLQEYVDELVGIGIELKDYETGLIDFTARHQGRDVYLCWRLGEEKIDYWHELQAGFAGRQPVSTLAENE
jgi:hypothetical protein